MEIFMQQNTSASKILNKNGHGLVGQKDRDGNKTEASMTTGFSTIL